MRATRFTHASVHARDLEESVRFYTDVFGMRRVPSPDFPDMEVEWLEAGDVQLHIFKRDMPAPDFHHVGFDVDDFEAAYREACERGLFDGGEPHVRELNDGALQMYLPRSRGQPRGGQLARRKHHRPVRRDDDPAAVRRAPAERGGHAGDALSRVSTRLKYRGGANT